MTKEQLERLDYEKLLCADLVELQKKHGIDEWVFISSRGREGSILNRTRLCGLFASIPNVVKLFLEHAGAASTEQGLFIDKRS
jgi:hypothetical protein